MWENISAKTGKPTDIRPSLDHGWSSGAAPALTTQVLGVKPVAPGFAKFTVTPHPGDLEWAKGDIPTPHGTIHVSWQLVAGKPVVTVVAPRGDGVGEQPREERQPRAVARGVSQRAVARDRRSATGVQRGWTTPR